MGAVRKCLLCRLVSELSILKPRHTKRHNVRDVEGNCMEW
jgi:hypothetical protein